MAIDDPLRPAARPSHAPAVPPHLAAVPGFDLSVALRNVGGSVVALERVLATFVRHYRHGEPALCDAESPDTLQRWRAACHSLRGACSTIGAASLPAGFAEFEQALVPQADLAALAPTARSLHEALLASVTALAAALVPPATS